MNKVILWSQQYTLGNVILNKIDNPINCQCNNTYREYCKVHQVFNKPCDKDFEINSNDKPLIILASDILIFSIYDDYVKVNDKKIESAIIKFPLFEITITPIESQIYKKDTVPLLCPRCKTPHTDLGPFANKKHTTHYCVNCGIDFESNGPVIGHSYNFILDLF